MDLSKPSYSLKKIQNKLNEIFKISFKRGNLQCICFQSFTEKDVSWWRYFLFPLTYSIFVKSL